MLLIIMIDRLLPTRNSIRISICEWERVEWMKLQFPLFEKSTGWTVLCKHFLVSKTFNNFVNMASDHCLYSLHSTLTQYKHPLTLPTDGICTHFSRYQVSTNLNGFACKLHQHTHIAFDAWKYPNFKCPAECKWSCVLLYLVLYGKCTVHSIRLVLVQRKQKKNGVKTK